MKTLDKMLPDIESNSQWYSKSHFSKCSESNDHSVITQIHYDIIYVY